jgi:hypothetical protein
LNTERDASGQTGLDRSGDDAAASQRPPEPHVDPSQIQYVNQQLRSRQNLPFAIAAGLVASLAGASGWAVITVLTGYQIGFMAIGVGILVGLFVRSAGKGIDPVFGVTGAALAMFGCILGNLMAICGLVALEEGVAFMEVFSRLTPGIAASLLSVTFSPIDLLFYGLALWQGYKLSFRQLSQEELRELAPVAASTATPTVTD